MLYGDRGYYIAHAHSRTKEVLVRVSASGGRDDHAEEEAANGPPHLKALYEFGVSQARAARSVIARFGRHPHRNEVLGRTSTPEELEYLRTETPPHLRRPPS